MSHCALFSHSVKLPEWGFEQQEVTCIKGGKIAKTVWYIESTENSLCKCFLCLYFACELILIFIDK